MNIDSCPFYFIYTFISDEYSNELRIIIIFFFADAFWSCWAATILSGHVARVNVCVMQSGCASGPDDEENR